MTENIQCVCEKKKRDVRREQEATFANNLHKVIVKFPHLRSVIRGSALSGHKMGKDHFAVLCSIIRPLNKSKTGVDLVLIQTSLLFLLYVHQLLQC